MRVLVRLLTLLVVGVFSVARPANNVVARQPTSTNYSLSEVFVGAGGTLDSSSANFQAKASIGDLGVGLSESSLYQIFAGFTTTDQPYLEFYVDTGAVDLGGLSSTATATATANFYVRTYLSSGYVVTPVGNSPTNENGDTISNMSTNAASTTGVEQFGINLVANTSPVSFGANPVQVPDSSFSFGTAAANYNTANSYRYNAGETIARSTESTGQTNYTVSYVFNISPITEAGQYTTEQVFVATSTF